LNHQIDENQHRERL